MSFLKKTLTSIIISIGVITTIIYFKNKNVEQNKTEPLPPSHSESKSHQTSNEIIPSNKKEIESEKDKEQQEWLDKQTKLIKHDINIMSREDIQKHMELCGVYDVIVSNNSITNYNSNSNKVLCYNFKNPPKDLLGVYFKPRNNHFEIKYPYDNNKYTLEDILKYEIAIEEAYIFWDAKQKTKDENIRLELINLKIYPYNEQTKIEEVNKYLINNNIIKKHENIQLGCYNGTPNTGLVAFLPENKIFENKTIEAVYFDDGIRVMEPNSRTIEDLVKLSNGAKKIYLFAFEENEKQKEQQDCLDTQPKLKRNDITIMSKKDIPNKMKSLGVDGVNIKEEDYDKPLYNRSGSKILNWEFKNPPTNLLGVYFKTRNNPSKIEYPYGDSNNIFTLDELLNYNIPIEEAFIFWKEETPNPKEKKVDISPNKNIIKHN
ncbi:MAG: hypothetical protein ACN23H_00410 [Candidatus Phytoplasma vitis]|nr:MAG: hypothetical protein M6G77_02685 [Candidatus Phytoplasma vitis]